MSAYIASADLQGRLKTNFSRLYDLPADQSDLDADLTGVCALVDSFAGRRYAVPVTDATALVVVKQLALDLAEELAWRRASGSEIPKKVKDAADTARRHLEAIAAGRMSLAGAAPTENDNAGASAILVDGNPPEFDRDGLKGY